MERELWPLLYHELRETANDFRQKYVQIPGRVLVAVSLWAALHDRPVAWACDGRNWGTTSLRPRKLPSPSTMSRRGLLRRRRACSGAPSQERLRRPRPLARPGRHARRRAAARRRLHQGPRRRLRARGRPDGQGLQAARGMVERAAARRVGGDLPEGRRDDRGGRHARASARAWRGRLPAGGRQLRLEQAVRPGRRGGLPVGGADGARQRRAGARLPEPWRLRCVERMRGRAKSDFGPSLYGMRTGIERSFGNATSFGGGLGPLPAWVRRLHRVRTWVWAKLLINAARIPEKIRTYVVLAIRCKGEGAGG